jgi:hypothetical protein
MNRCSHCKSPYVYHPSFYGGEEINYPHNHHEYCPECYQIVQEALSKVPTKYEKKFVPTNEYTREQIIQHQEKRGPLIRRIFPGLFAETEHKIVCEHMDGEWYKAEWWTHEPEVVSITKEVWQAI